MITLIPKKIFRYPIEGKNISPDIFSEKTLEQIANLEMYEGNMKLTIGDLFDIRIESTSSEEFTIKIDGNVGKVRNIGFQMSNGKILVNGDVGMHLGEEMNGGSIVVSGNAGSWVGSQMKNGLIEIKGNAGDYIGAAYRGSTNGMKGGKIVIHGDAGHEVGCFMNNGVIKILGNVGIFVGIHMVNGTIFVKGTSQGRAGAQMTNGKIVLAGKSDDVLPSFTIDEIKEKVKVDGEKILGPFYKFIGDIADNGKGKLFVNKEKNPYLINYEKFL